MSLQSFFEEVYRISESRKISSVDDFYEKGGLKFIAGILGGKKFIPAYLMDEEYKPLLEKVIARVLESPFYKNDNKFASDQAIAFVVKVSKTPDDLKDLIGNHFDTVIEFGRCCNAEWFKKDSVVKELLDSEYSGENMHKLEKYLQDEHAKRSKHKSVKATNTGSLYETLYDDGIWKLCIPKNFEGDAELASHIEPFMYDGNEYNKTRWCTAASKGHYNEYTDNGELPLYVIQKYENGKYVDAWQIAFCELDVGQPHKKPHIEIMDKRDKRDWHFLKSCPQDLVSKIIDTKNNICITEVLNVVDFSRTEAQGNDELNNKYKLAVRLPQIREFFPDYKLGDIVDIGSDLSLYKDDLQIDYKISIPDGITEIDPGQFDGLRYLVIVEIPSSVISIGQNAFQDCTRLTSINIPNSVTSIGMGAFASCINLTSITIPDSVTSINSAAFYNCSRLTSITIPDSVTSIGIGAFEFCTSLTSIEIPNSVTSIGMDAFDGCNSLTSINIPSSVTSIGKRAFCKCSSLTSINISDGVTSIGIGAFESCTSLTSIEIPSSVTEIDEKAFYNCSRLTSIAISDGVTSIGTRAFYGCTSLTSITIPNSVTSIGINAFGACTSLTDIILPNNITSIIPGILCGCTSLKSINIPSSVTSIGEAAFSACTSLTSIEIPDSVTSIGEDAFDGCVSIESIEIPSSVTSIGKRAFANCTNLTSINIPDGVTSIDECVFMGCTNLSTINFKGTQEEWAAISKDDEWDYGCPSNMRVNFLSHVVNPMPESLDFSFIKKCMGL